MEFLDLIKTEYTNLLLMSLIANSPVLSGNTKQNIRLEDIDSEGSEISVSAPSYDLALWKKTKAIVHDGRYDYAVSVNEFGAFGGTSLKSKGWVDNAAYQTAIAIASANNGIVILLGNGGK